MPSKSFFFFFTTLETTVLKTVARHYLEEKETKLMEWLRQNKQDGVWK